MTPDPAAFLPLHPLELRILMVLLPGAAHGYHIVQEIEAREAGLTLYPANLYRRIRDLLGRGLLEEAAPTDGAADGRRRYVAVTPLGRAVARAEAERLAALVRDARAVDLLGEA